METVAFRLPRPLRERVEEYAESVDGSTSVAGRDLLRQSFDKQDELEELRQENNELRAELEEQQEHAEQTIAITKPTAVSLIGWYMIALGVTAEPVALMVGLGAALIIPPILYMFVKRQRAGANHE